MDNFIGCPTIISKGKQSEEKFYYFTMTLLGINMLKLVIYHKHYYNQDDFIIEAALQMVMNS
jgi:hypothetical protein